MRRALANAGAVVPIARLDGDEVIGSFRTPVALLGVPADRLAGLDAWRARDAAPGRGLLASRIRPASDPDGPRPAVPAGGTARQHRRPCARRRACAEAPVGGPRWRRARRAAGHDGRAGACTRRSRPPGLANGSPAWSLPGFRGRSRPRGTRRRRAA